MKASTVVLRPIRGQAVPVYAGPRGGRWGTTRDHIPYISDLPHTPTFYSKYLMVLHNHSHLGRHSDNTTAYTNIMYRCLIYVEIAILSFMLLDHRGCYNVKCHCARALHGRRTLYGSYMYSLHHARPCHIFTNTFHELGSDL